MLQASGGICPDCGSNMWAGVKILGYIRESLCVLQCDKCDFYLPASEEELKTGWEMMGDDGYRWGWICLKHRNHEPSIGRWTKKNNPTTIQMQKLICYVDGKIRKCDWTIWTGLKAKK